MVVVMAEVVKQQPYCRCRRCSSWRGGVEARIRVHDGVERNLEFVFAHVCAAPPSCRRMIITKVPRRAVTTSYPSTMEASATLASSSSAVPSGLASQTILLDSDIRDWVVLPLLVIMIAAGLLRHFVSILLKGKSKPLSRGEQRAKSDLQRAARIRSGSANFISTQQWNARRDYYSGVFLRDEAEWATEEKETNPSSGGPDPMNPMSMMDGKMGNMAFMVGFCVKGVLLLECVKCFGLSRVLPTGG